MSPTIRNTASLTIEIGPAKGVHIIRIYETSTERVLIVTKGDLTNAQFRRRIVASLPGDYQQEAEQALLALADQLVASAIDAALAELEHRDQAPSGGDAPWPDPVDGAALYRALVAAFRKYLVLPSPEAAQALALWTMFSHAHNSFEFSPLLVITGPTRECGKTRVCDVLRHVARRVQSCVGISDAALFRLIEAREPTIMVDEADNIDWRQRRELAALLNSGFTLGAARIPRCVGEEHEVKDFSTWCPKVLAGKNARRILSDTTLSRSITITMRKRLRSETVERFREKRAARELGPLRRQAARWAADHAAQLAEVEPKGSFDQLTDRAEDAWTPLLTIADDIGIGDEARKTAVALSGGDEATGDDSGVDLLRTVREVFATKGDPKHLPTTELLTALNEMTGEQWRGWNNGRGVNARDLSSRLRDFGLAPKTINVGTMTNPKGYSLSPLIVALAPYDDFIRNSATPIEIKELMASDPPATEEKSCGTKTGPNSLNTNDSCGVADEIAENRCGTCGTGDCIGETCAKCDPVGWTAAWKAQHKAAA